MGTILLFNVNKGKKKKIELIAWKLRHEVKQIERKDLQKTLGSLVGIPSFGKQNPPGMAETKNEYSLSMNREMMVFSGLDSDALDEFLDEFKNAGLDSIQMKAVITESNVFWTAQKLYSELEEHSRS